MRKFRWVSAIAILILIATALPVQAAAIPAATETTDKQVGSLTPTVVSRLEKAVQELIGSKTSFQFDDVTDMGKTWIVEGELEDGTATLQTEYNKEKNRVDSTTIRYKISSLGKAMNAPLKAKVLNSAKAFDSKRPLQFEAFWRVKSPYQTNKPSNYWVFWGAGEKASSLYVDVDQGNAITVNADYALKQVDPVLLNRAMNTFKRVSGQRITVQHVSRYKDEKKGLSYWSFEDASEANEVKIGAVTGKVLTVSTPGMDWDDDADFKKSFASPKYTAAEALKLVKPKVQLLFNINVSGYKVKVQGNQYTFSKQQKGTDSIVAKVNKKGTFYEFSLHSSDGKMQ
ncbi:hypothetical protein G9G63_01485 [Paenibacillus sp. EKM202P]|uniref:hypothetical protein n=1 Tax=unclassified Paenibacillus TaxID=185978 RepID=UPI0013E9EC65|nr:MULTISPECIES: hypothetical protein [unclassified Paenibacillus]KAF6568522.1 hypothetical protein G9G63_01485 [Paenibacillus sp. EKM202P]KAF6570367.1 hypothetical protein G9G64_09400 [Paenibacillus sp. EKM207P]